MIIQKLKCVLTWITQIDPLNRGTAFSVIGSNTSASTFLASTSLSLTSLIGTWVGSSSNNAAITKFIYGNKSASVNAMKYVSVVVFFLVAFASFIQSTRSYVQANFFLSMPLAEVPVEYVEEALSRGHNFWQLGLRAIYFATNLLLWVFGPIPMFASSVATVTVLHVIDANTKTLHEFPNPDKHNLKKVGEEISAMAAMALHHHDRPEGIQTTA